MLTKRRDQYKISALRAKHAGQKDMAMTYFKTAKVGQVVHICTLEMYIIVSMQALTIQLFVTVNKILEFIEQN